MPRDGIPSALYRIVVAPRFRCMEPGGPLQSPARRSQAPQGSCPEAMRTAERANGFDIVAASCSERSYGRKCKIKGHYSEGNARWDANSTDRGSPG